MSLTRACVTIPLDDVGRFKASLCPMGKKTASVFDRYSHHGVLKACVSYACPNITNCCANTFSCTQMRPPVPLEGLVAGPSR